VYKELPLVVDTFAKTTVQPIKKLARNCSKTKTYVKMSQNSLKKRFFQKFDQFFSVKKK
jgi:hypothetical protein